MLQILGHEVETAFDGVEALEKAEQFRPDLVVLDIGMPKLDGLQTARRLRQHPWARDTVLIAVTGWGSEKDKRKSLEAGFDVHLVKPIDGIAIQGILDRIGESKAGLRAEKNS
jgi:Response regulator containing a CheY-like receiver domain and a GGDEF domain